jgi:hypothetical protein
MWRDAGGRQEGRLLQKGLARSLHARYTSLHRHANAIVRDGLLGDGDTDSDEPG